MRQSVGRPHEQTHAKSHKSVAENDEKFSEQVGGSAVQVHEALRRSTFSSASTTSVTSYTHVSRYIRPSAYHIVLQL